MLKIEIGLPQCLETSATQPLLNLLRLPASAALLMPQSGSYFSVTAGPSNPSKRLSSLLTSAVSVSRSRHPGDRGGGSARDLFLYLLSFISLGIWSQALGQIAFIATDRFFDDPLSRSGNFSYGLASSLARLIVLYPVYLLLMRLLLSDLAANPNKYQSGLRKWLTYLALTIAALIAIGDLILFFTEFLRGALTLVFTLKSLIVLVIAGGIIWYYLSWLQKQPANDERN